MEADLTTSFLFGFSLEGRDLSPKKVVSGGKIGGNRGEGLCGYEDGKKLGNIFGGGVKNGSGSDCL